MKTSVVLFSILVGAAIIGLPIFPATDMALGAEKPAAVLETRTWQYQAALETGMLPAASEGFVHRNRKIGFAEHRPWPYEWSGETGPGKPGAYTPVAERVEVGGLIYRLGVDTR